MNCRSFSSVRISLIFAILIPLFTGCASMGKLGSTDSNNANDASDISAYIRQGDIEFANSNLEAARVQYLLALEQDSENAALYFKLGTIQRIENNLAAAEKTLQIALELDPTHIPTKESLGLVQLKMENYKVATVLLENVVETDNSRWRALNALGVISDLTLDYENAQSFYAKALALRPDSAIILNNLGYSYYLSSKYDLAEKQFKRVVDLHPGYKKAWSNLALVFLQRNQTENARLAFEKTVDSHQALNNIGYFKLLENDAKSARENFLSATKESPSYYSIAEQNLTAMAGSNTNTGETYKYSNITDSIDNEITANTVESAAPPNNDSGTPGVKTFPVPEQSEPLPSANTSILTEDENVFRVQTELLNLGYDPGPIDGVMGSKTENAIKQYQRDRGMTEDGKITSELMNDLS